MGNSRISYIYCLIDPRNNQIIYIGQSVNPRARYNRHVADSKYANTHNRSWIKGLIDLGFKPVLDIIEESSCGEIDFWEQHYISLYKSWGFDLTNHDLGGKSHRVYSKFMRDKMSLAKTNNWNDPVYREKQTNIFKTKNISQETRDKYRELSKNTIQSKEVRAKASIGIKKALNTKEYKEKRSELSKNMWDNMSNEDRALKINTFHSKEARKKAQESLKITRKTEEYKATLKAATRIRFYKEFDVFNKSDNKFIGTWSNQTDCGKDLNICYVNIGACLRGIAKSAKGYIFKYKENVD